MSNPLQTSTELNDVPKRAHFHIVCFGVCFPLVSSQVVCGFFLSAFNAQQRIWIQSDVHINIDCGICARIDSIKAKLQASFA